jgi:hypothetical protein
MKMIWLATAFSLLVAGGESKKISPRVMARLAQDDRPALVWVYLQDKGPTPLVISKKAEERRKRAAVLPPRELDVPVRADYVEQLKAAGLDVRHHSRWLNAVSGHADGEAIRKMAGFSWVRHIDRVAQFRRPGYEPVEADLRMDTRPSLGKAAFDSSAYGASYGQVKLLKVPLLHDENIAGDGVIVGVFDTGFDNLGHDVFDSLQVLAMYDFVNDDSNVANEGDLGSGSHGTATLSVLAGYKPGSLIGPAFRSKFLLAKTENTQSETPAEEDNWIAALEWAEALGADVISSSLGYLDMDAGSSRSYDYTWMSGDSTVITKAANIGVGMGLIIVNSAGNEADRGTPNTLSAPADGDSVIAVGAVSNTGSRASFSSYGPTTLGRIKPDVMAPGVNVRVAASTGNVYNNLSGTSFSCPLVAGVCAQILSAHPNVSPAQMRHALRSTAVKSSFDGDSSPNGLYGYGIVDAAAAVNVFGVVIDPGLIIPQSYALYQNFPNPFNLPTTIRFDLPESARVRLAIYNTLGQRVRTLIDADLPARSLHETSWDGRDDGGREVASGVYFYRLDAGRFQKTRRMLLLK